MKISRALESTFNDLKKFNQTFFTSRVYRIAESNILISYYNKEIYDLLSRAICHLESKEQKIDLSIYAVSSAAYPFNKPEISDHLISLEKVYSDCNQGIFFTEDSNYKLSYQKDLKICEISFFNSLSNQAIFYLDSLKLDKSDVLASPFRNILAWHFLRTNKILLHASAVGNETGGIIFVGPGGSGKSSCSYAALKANLKFLADDSVIVSKDFKAYSIYNTFRLNQNDLTKFNLDSNNGFISEDKKINFYLNEINRTDLINTFPIKAIIAPTISENKSGFELIKSIEALTVSAPSTLMHIPGYRERAFKLLAKIVNSNLSKYRYFINQNSVIGEDLCSLI